MLVRVGLKLLAILGLGSVFVCRSLRVLHGFGGLLPGRQWQTAVGALPLAFFGNTCRRKEVNMLLRCVFYGSMLLCCQIPVQLGGLARRDAGICCYLDCMRAMYLPQRSG